MNEEAVVTCFLRNDGEILLYRRDTAGSDQGQWGGVAAHLTDDDGTERNPETAARAAISEATGLDGSVTLVRAGEPFQVEDEAGSQLVHPFLFDCDTRDIEASEATAEVAWVHPPAIRRRETVPGLWASYDRVRPRVATVREDRRHGSTWLAVRALETLRDEAALAVEGAAGDRTTGDDPERDGDDWDALAALARRIRDARPAMAIIENRVNRAMFAASDERTPAAVERAARGAVEQSVGAGREAARTAADDLPDRVATLSRSGTVETALRTTRPAAVLVAESRPGGEGIGVAEALAPMTDVTLTTDAAFAAELAEWDAGAVVVGADRVLPDGRVVNKVGTRSAALAAGATGIDCLVVCASDKVAGTDGYDREVRDAHELYEGDADIAVTNPTFDVTPADAVTAIITEQGRLSTAEVAAVAESHCEWATWDDAD